MFPTTVSSNPPSSQTLFPEDSQESEQVYVLQTKGVAALSRQSMLFATVQSEKLSSEPQDRGRFGHLRIRPGGTEESLPAKSEGTPPDQSHW
jgi:hypothetical protein